MEPQPISNPSDRPVLTDEQKRAAEAKPSVMILEITKQVYKTGDDEEQAVYHKHPNVLYPHEVRALPDAQKQELAETIVAWRNAPENIGFLETLSTDRVLDYIERNEVFAYIANGELLACARLYPDLEHQRNGQGRVIFGMAMKRPVTFSTTENPESKAAFKYVAHARLVLCANAYPNLRPRTSIDVTNTKNIDYHLNTLGLDEVIPEDPNTRKSRITVKLNKLVEPLKGIAPLPEEVINAYKHVSPSERDPESSSPKVSEQAG